MAVNEIKNPSSLRIKLDLGMVDGKTKVKSKTFSSVKPDVSAQNVYEVAEALMTLQEYTTIEIAKIDNTTLA
ncbi:DUF1659 domain-containing protein [Romboutsia ilealis]|uniref:DUF1659 domain-containing protein n=1 Tax=Romboutsia ilealis TaxID=1115758 RepID=UPI00272F2AF2|nr:DUF1659 domain-containing protein [Romboutsia ilealis]